MTNSAVQVAKAVLDRQERYLKFPEDVSAMALLQAWDHLVDTPVDIAKALSVKEMSQMVVAAATAFLSMYEICEGEVLKEAKVIGQRAVGRFEVTIKGTTFVLQWVRGGPDSTWRWSAGKRRKVTKKKTGTFSVAETNPNKEIVWGETLEAVCKNLQTLEE